jgi:hypothetical protein
LSGKEGGFSSFERLFLLVTLSVLLTEELLFDRVTFAGGRSLLFGVYSLLTLPEEPTDANDWLLLLGFMRGILSIEGVRLAGSCTDSRGRCCILEFFDW